MKWLAAVFAVVYVVLVYRTTHAWAPALGTFGAFCNAIVIVTACLVGFGSLAIGLGVAIVMYIYEALFRRGKVKTLEVRPDKETKGARP